MNIKGYELKLTCSACPEQYDVFKDEKKVAYLRLRHGEFRADVPGCGDETIYESEEMKGDGIFDDDERMQFLTDAIDAVDRHYKEDQS